MVFGFSIQYFIFVFPKLGMKMIMWEDEQYFVTLANLWSNLVSHNPPELPHLHIGT